MEAGREQGLLLEISPCLQEFEIEKPWSTSCSHADGYYTFAPEGVQLACGVWFGLVVQMQRAMLSVNYSLKKYIVCCEIPNTLKK